MNKKVNTILFILGATLFNVFITVTSFVLLWVVYEKFIKDLLPKSAQNWYFQLIFISSIVISFFVYRFILKFLLKKIEMEKYFDPIFGGTRRK